jgi:hypothetical protein
MSVPVAGMELARHRMPKKYLQRATTFGELYNGEQSVEVVRSLVPLCNQPIQWLSTFSSLLRTHLQGYLDQAVPPEQVLAVAKVEAARLAPLPNPGFAQTKNFERGPVAQVVKDAMWNELSRIKGSKPPAKLWYSCDDSIARSLGWNFQKFEMESLHFKARIDIGLQLSSQTNMQNQNTTTKS